MFERLPEADPSQQHVMQLAITYTTGAEVWLCPTCGRRFMMQWQPEFQRIILEPGDDMAPHSGSKGGLRLGPIQADLGDQA